MVDIDNKIIKNKIKKIMLSLKQTDENENFKKEIKSKKSWNQFQKKMILINQLQNIQPFVSKKLL